MKRSEMQRQLVDLAHNLDMKIHALQMNDDDSVPKQVVIEELDDMAILLRDTMAHLEFLDLDEPI